MSALRCRRGAAGALLCLAALGWAVAARAERAAPPVDGLAFATDPAARRRCLGLSAAEMAARLGPAELEFTATTTLAAAGRPAHHQSDRALALWDDAAGISLQIGAGEMSLEVVRAGDAVVVRYNRGQLRRKSALDMDVEQLADQAVGNLGQALALLGPLQLAAGVPQTYERRAALRHAISAGEATAEAAPPIGAQQRRVDARLPATWRPDLGQRRIAGWVLVDQVTGVVLGAEVDASAQILHPRATPVALTCRLRHQLRRVGHRQRVVAPEGLPEFRRLSRPRDPLAFFREAPAG